MKIIFFVFTGFSGKTNFFKKKRSNFFFYFSKMDKNKCPFSKITCTLFLVFLLKMNITTKFTLIGTIYMYKYWSSIFIIHLITVIMK